jgi:hypothetical protein
MMQHITGIPQSAIFSSLEDTILRKTRSFYRCFWSISITNFRFSVQTIKGPWFQQQSVSRYLYGYLNGIRSGGIWKGMF